MSWKVPISGAGEASNQRRRGFVLVAVTYAAVLVGVTLPSPLYGIYQVEYGLSTAQVTALFATYPAVVLVVLAFTGTWSDALGRRACLLIAVLTSMASSVAFLLAESPQLLFVGRAFTGVASGLVVASANAALIDLEPYHRKGLGSLASSTINQVGLGVGALAAGLAADHLSAPTRTAYAAHVVIVALALVALAFVPETAPRTTTFSVRPTAPTLPIEHRAALFAASAAGFAAFAFCGLVAALAPFFVWHAGGADHHTEAGAAVFTLFFMSAVSQAGWSRIEPSVVTRRALITFVVSLAGFVAGVAAATSWAFFAALCLAGVGVGGVFMGSLQTANGLGDPDHRSGVVMTYFLATFAGLIIPVVGAGWLIDHSGLRTAAVTFGTLLGLVCACCLVAEMGKERHPSS